MDPLLVESYQLDQSDIFPLISRNNRLVAAGSLDTGKGRFPVKVPSVYQSITDILEQPIKARGDRVITFGQVATIRRSFKDPVSYAYLNGAPAISLEIKKRPGENLIALVEGIKSQIDAKRSQWPASVSVLYTWDASEHVEMMLSDLQNSVLIAVILVVIVIVALLGLRTAALVGISIPGSFLTGILVLAVFGYTINMVVLFSLIMAVGLLVDGAIVVTEYADRAMSEGQHRQQAYALAARRMAMPIIASTATTLAAFAPLLFWPGIVGEFMKYLPITLIATLSASLVMALIFVPVLGSWWGGPRPVTPEIRQRYLGMEKGDLSGLTGWTASYIKLLRLALEHPWKIVLLASALALLVFWGYGRSGLGSEFFPEVEPEGITVTLRSDGDLSLDEKDLLVRQASERLIDVSGLESLYVRVGGEEELGRLRLNLIDWQYRPDHKQISREIEQRLSILAGVEVEIQPDKDGPPVGKDLVLELSSQNPEELPGLIKQLRKIVEENPAFLNVDDTAPRAGIEWRLAVDRSKAARFGADATLLGNTVQLVTNGLRVGEYRPDDVDDEVEIRVRFPKEQRNLQRLQSLRVQTALGTVPIRNFVTLEPKPRVSVISKVDTLQTLTLSADMQQGYLLSLELPKLLEQIREQKLLPESVLLNVRGENEEQEESSAFLSKAFALALFVMAIILVTQFNSFYQAFLILTAVLFSTVGVLLGLMIAQKPFGVVMSGIGVIALVGIVVNNNIVLIDTYNRLRRQGLSQIDAILTTGAQRLRPVMLTSVTTILGLLPMVLEINLNLIDRSIEFGGPSMQWWSQLATVVAGGLAFATLLTLVMTPCLLRLNRREARIDYCNRQVQG